MRYAVLLLAIAAPAFGQVNLGSPVPLPGATNLATNPHFAAMQKQAAASGRDVYMRLHEQGAPAPRWFKCDPQGWISYSDLPPGAELVQPVEQVTYQPAPRREVAAPRPFRGVPGDDHYCHRCGNETRIVEQSLPGGKHSHRCNACGYRWVH